MHIRRIAIIFDNRARPETTGHYCLAALRSLAETVHLLPDELGSATKGDIDLYLRIDDGFDYPTPVWARPLAWWAIDTHLDLQRCITQSADADLTFAAQRAGTDALCRVGLRSQWLPLACDPAVHRRHDVPKRFDFAFVGNIFPGPRADLIALLRERHASHFVGQAYFDDMARIYSEARATFNRSVRDDLNMRVFEAMACGSLLLTNDLPEAGQDELFQDGIHLATYRDGDELLDKLSFYMAHAAARTRVEEAGRAAVTAGHTYRHRMAHILASAESIPQTVHVSSSVPTPSAGAVYDPGYFEFERPELLVEIPLGAREVLDVGCGAGRLGAAVKERQPARVTGVEFDHRAADAARTRLDHVVEGDVESPATTFQDGSFDAIVCGDVLEHLREPLAFLRRARTWLRPAGRLVASVPNVRHHSVLRSLLAGNWTYEPSGLLDRTHLRFFTRREVEKLFYRAGFAADPPKPVAGPGHAEWVAVGRPAEVRVGGLSVQTLSPAEAEEFYAYQWLVAATPEPDRDWGLTSVVIPVYNQLEYTRQCIDSLRLVTDEPYEIVMVDNGSTDGTSDYLLALAETDPRVRVIRNGANHGFPAAANQGIAAAAGRQVILLNNDTVLTTGWLHRLLTALRSAPNVGLAGPCSNRVSGEQEVHVAYDELSALDGFAWDWGKEHAGILEETDRLVGFCLAIRREVIDSIGLLDERFGLGNFEDDDYCRRARAAGFRTVIARDAFVHHVGGQTFRALGVDFAGLMRANQELYARKWGPPEEKTVAEVRPLIPLPPVRVLLLANVSFFRDRMGKGIFHRYRALARRPGVTLFGPGVDGYAPGMTIDDAVRVACGGACPDAIIHGCDPWASCRPLVTGLDRAPSVTAIEVYDSWAFEDRQFDFIRRNLFALGLMAADGQHIEHYQAACPATRFVWAPNAVDTEIFRDWDSPKDYDIILYGALSPEVYPLRARLAALLNRQSEFRVRHIPHPGYYPSAEEQGSVIAGKRLSEEINRAWIGIATSSVYRCLLEKYLEISASGALVAGDMPRAARPVFRDDFVELGLGDSDESVMRRLRDALRDKDRLRAMAAAARSRVVSEFSTEAFADRVLELLAAAVTEKHAQRTSRTAVGLKGDNLQSGPTRWDNASAFVVRSAPSGGLLLEPAIPNLSVCLIVRDNEGTIRACLQSIRPWADELVVVDTGSTDSTARIAAELGARVFHFHWCDDFSAARNESLRHARGRWVFWMDSDDTIDATNGRKLRELAGADHPANLLGFVVRVHCPGPRGNGKQDLTIVDHVKLFRNSPGLRFDGRIHEQILPAIRRAGGEVAWTDLFVTHSGYDHTPDGQERKKRRDLRLLHLELLERPEHPFTLFNLGMTYGDIGRHAEAVNYLERGLQAADAGDSHVRKLFALLAHSRTQLGQPELALDVCRRGLAQFPDDLELEFRQGVILHQLGRKQEAVAAYERVLAVDRERYFVSVDTGIAGFKAWQNLAVVWADLCEHGRAEAAWRHVVDEAPDYRPGWRGLADSLLHQEKFAELTSVADRLAAEPGMPGESELLRGNAAAAQGDIATARGSWERAAEKMPDDPEPLRCLAQLLFETHDDEQARQVLEKLAGRAPEDAAALHNLGLVHLRSGRPADAVVVFERSLRLRPRSVATLLSLGYARLADNDPELALAAWTDALGIDPGNPEAASAIRGVSSGQPG